MIDTAQPSTTAEDPLTPPVLLESITVESPPSETDATLNTSSESDPEIRSDDDLESEQGTIEKDR